jgi:lipocalin-like protein
LNDELIGLWRLVSAQAEHLDSGEVEDIYGPDPLGYLLVAPGGRMMELVTSSGNRENDPAALFNSMMAFSGLSRVDGDRWITDVDVAWFPAWLGAQQERSFSVEGSDLYIRGGPILHPLELGRRVRGILHWRREDSLAR